MPWDNRLAVALFMGLLGLVILVLLWPGEKHGVRMLARWGVREPSPDEVAETVKYLRRRRFWYPWLFLGLSYLIDLAGSHAGELPLLLGTLLLGALLAELSAQRPPRRVYREAALIHRGVGDLVPPWSLWLYGALFVLIAGVSSMALAGAEWARRWMPDAGFALVATAVVGLIGWTIVLLAVRRPASGDTRVDAALRRRSAQVAIGLSIGFLGVLVA